MALSVIRFDLREPRRDPADTRRAYGAAVEMAAWADKVGLDTIVLDEHHGAGDNHLSSPLTLAAAMAARTTRIPLTIAGLLVPLHDPIRLAEDLAVIDLLSGGRLSVVVELGDRPSEYWMLGKDWNSRSASMDESLATMQRAWTGEPFDHNGDTVQVTPRPFQQPHPLVFVGGRGTAEALRAARFGFGLYPPGGDAELVRAYREECERLSRRPGFVIVPPTDDRVFVAADPDAAWAAVGEHLLFDASAEQRWLSAERGSARRPRAATVAELRAEGRYRILTPPACVELLAERGAQGTVTLHPLCGGIPPAMAWQSLELYASQVLPASRARPEAPRSRR